MTKDAERMSRASSAHPCPVCEKEDWCLVAPDGSAAICSRVESPKRAGEAGWLHRLAQPTSPPPRPERKPTPPKDWSAEAKRFAANLDGAGRAGLAAGLGLPPDALDVLPLLGHHPTDPAGACFTFPEHDAAGAVIGLNRRFADGSKRTAPGGKRGLTLPDGWRDRPGPLLIPEGPTDSVALVAADLCAVGRPSNTGGSKLLAELLRDWPADRDILIVGEHDAKDDGSWPGRDGATATARELATQLARPVRWALPPAGAKDVRAWLTASERRDASWPERGRELLSHLEAKAAAVNPPDRPGASEKPGEEKKARPAAADVLIGLALSGAELFHDAGQVAYATFGAKTVKVRGRAFRLWLSGLYHRQTGGKAANAEAVACALATLEAHAIYASPERAAHVRLAEHGDAVYLHLADDAGTVVAIDAAGWRTCDSPPVRFLTTPNATPLPMPRRGGALAELRDFVNCPDDDAFALLAGWLSAGFQQDGPFPLLVLTGQQGSAKSTTARVLKSLTDPEKVRDRCAPKDVRDLAIWAAASRLLCCDNLSGFPDWLSDAFCRLATGGGFGTRTLYENDEETIFDAKRPVILNGIEDFVTRGDLLERSIILRHPAIPDGERRTESELWAAFDRARPRLLGAILDRVAAGLRSLARVDRRNLPRMADACAFAVACELGMGEPEQFLDAYRQNQGDSHEMALADSIIASPIVALMDGRTEWVGTATELYDAIRPAGDKLPHGWPKKPSALSGVVRRLAPSLAKVHGITVTSERTPGGKRTRVIRIVRAEAENVRESASRPSRRVPADPAEGTAGTSRDDRDGTSRGHTAPGGESRETGSVKPDAPNGTRRHRAAPGPRLDGMNDGPDLSALFR